MTDRWYRVVYVQDQGYGTMTPKAWSAMPETHRGLVRVLQLCDSQEGATAVYRKLPQEWHSKKHLREASIPPELHVLADILGRLPPDRARAEIRALDWYATQSPTPSRRRGCAESLSRSCAGTSPARRD